MTQVRRASLASLKTPRRSLTPSDHLLVGYNWLAQNIKDLLTIFGFLLLIVSSFDKLNIGDPPYNHLPTALPIILETACFMFIWTAVLHVTSFLGLNRSPLRNKTWLYGLMCTSLAIVVFLTINSTKTKVPPHHPYQDYRRRDEANRAEASKVIRKIPENLVTRVLGWIHEEFSAGPLKDRMMCYGMDFLEWWNS